MKFLFLTLWITLLPAASAAGSPTGSLYDNLAPIQQSYWLKLLHYHKGKSRADGENFFLSPVGKTNPAAELQASIDAFSNPSAEAGWFKYHPQCVFRERFSFLSEAGLLKNIPVVSCPDFDEWKKGLNAESLTLVFSSSYPNNPSSLFGHTLIRLNQKGKTNDLLDYAVAFSAMPEHDDPGLVFAAKGMSGGYKGLIEVTKYYTKVNEYNNGESRDLIEYDLAMTEDELNRLINHLWEIYQTTYFDYFFTDENCSAVLVDVLAVPFHFDDVNSHARWYYLPSEMIKVFKKIPGRVKAEHFRPSLKKQLEHTLSKLSKVELMEVRVFAETEKDLPPNYDQIPVLDGLISLLNFTRYRTKDNLTEHQKVMLRKALLRRSALAQDTNNEKVLYDQSNSPDLGHEPQKISFFLRSEESHSLVGLEWKQGYHDLMSNDFGYDAFSQFDFLTGSLVYDKKLNRINYDQLTLVNLISLHTYKFFDPQFSWAAKIVADRIYDLKCDLCHRLNARGYVGPTIRPTPNMALSLMGGLFGEATKHYKHGFRVGVGFEGSAYFQITELLKLGFFDELRYDASHKMRRDYYNHAGAKISYFQSLNNEWRIESSVVSKFGSFKSESNIFQLNYGLYY